MYTRHYTSADDDHNRLLLLLLAAAGVVLSLGAAGVPLLTNGGLRGGGPAPVPRLHEPPAPPHRHVAADKQEGDEAGERGEGRPQQVVGGQERRAGPGRGGQRYRGRQVAEDATLMAAPALEESAARDAAALQSRTFYKREREESSGIGCAP